ncbi:MAG: porin family protein [Rhodomicrobium sp.]|nr:porin family protein [Rhodomicrobium sp.]
MIRSVLLGAAGVVALMSPAAAADIYAPTTVYKDIPVAVPVTAWTGFYLGINGGYGGSDGLRFRNDTFWAGELPPDNNLHRVFGTTDLSGGFGGGQIGYNLQSGAFVYGIEADIQGSGMTGRGTRSEVAPAADPFLYRLNTAGVDVNYFGTVRARLGYAFGGTLIYATGGFAYGGVDTTFTYADEDINNVRFAARATNSDTQTGWTVGGGIEVKLSPSWSLKGEYQFVDLGSFSDTRPLIVPDNVWRPYDTLRHESDVEFHTVRVGLNYSFTTVYEPLPLK